MTLANIISRYELYLSVKVDVTFSCLKPIEAIDVVEVKFGDDVPNWVQHLDEYIGLDDALNEEKESGGEIWEMLKRKKRMMRM